jgi:hypothetical protein
MQYAKFKYGRVDKVTYWVNHSISQGVIPSLMQYAKFKYGRVDKVTYWVNHSISQGVIPRWTSL